jgi:hypothetical protein
MTRSSSQTIPPCLACRQTPGHTTLCPSTDEEATYYLRHPIPGGHRDWTPNGIRFTGTPARRTAVRALMAKTHWARMHGNPELPMSPGLLINEILAWFGNASRKTARVGHTTGDFLTTVDCSCDLWRCTHDHDSPATASPDWVTEPGIDPDFLVNVTLVAVEVRWADTWQTFWFADTGGAVTLAIDEVPETSPPGISVACHRRWCDLCLGSTVPRGRETARTPCSCPHHTTTTS